MALVTIRGLEYEIDIEEELDKFEWEHARWTSDKLICRSPFRVDNAPSFFVKLDGEYAGAWGDSGATDEYLSSGGLVKLISLLEGRDYDEVADELIEKYSQSIGNGEIYEIPCVTLKSRRKKTAILDGGLLRKHTEGSEYLKGRGIDYETQEFFDVRTHSTQKAVAIPWYHIDGSLAAIKYRKEDDKKFWYEKGGANISELVYGLNYIYEYNAKEVVVCESEIDAMSWRVCGRYAIALGSSNLSKEQADLIRKSPIERLIMCLDKDEQGRKMGRQIVAEFRNVSFVRLPEGCKDANDVLKTGGDLSELVIEDYFEKLFERK